VNLNAKDITMQINFQLSISFALTRTCVVCSENLILFFFNNDSSESSMFVSKRRWILKTCGTTTPLRCLEPLLQLAAEIADLTEIENLFYSRKNYKRPELQVSPQRGKFPRIA
jgi:Adenosylmethionine decarboxylase